MSKRLEILENSLLKKESLFDSKLTTHIETVKQANGQPLNDKRNGQATLNKWEKQNDSLRTLNAGIETTKQAIEREKDKIAAVEAAKDSLPVQILELIEAGTLIQWRKHPNTFFVKDVDKARIVWDPKSKTLAHRYCREVANQEQYSIFAKTFNALNASLNERTGNQA